MQREACEKCGSRVLTRDEEGDTVCAMCGKLQSGQLHPLAQHKTAELHRTPRLLNNKRDPYGPHPATLQQARGAVAVGRALKGRGISQGIRRVA